MLLSRGIPLRIPLTRMDRIARMMNCRGRNTMFSCILWTCENGTKRKKRFNANSSPVSRTKAKRRPERVASLVWLMQQGPCVSGGIITGLQTTIHVCINLCREACHAMVCSSAFCSHRSRAQLDATPRRRYNASEWLRARNTRRAALRSLLGTAINRSEAHPWPVQQFWLGKTPRTTVPQ